MARALLFAGLAVAAAVVPARLGPASLVGPGGSALAFHETAQDFGTVFVGERVQRTFRFRNTADEPVRIVAAAGTCACVQARAPVRFLEPGAEGVIEASFLTDGRHGPQTLRIRVRTDEGERAGVLLTLRGRVRAVLRPEPPRLFLGQVAPGSRHEARVEVEAREPFSDLSLETRGAGLAAEVVDRTGAGFALAIAVDVAPRVGARFGGVLLAFHHDGTGRALETWVPVVWNVPPPLVVEPDHASLASGRAVLRVRARWPERVRFVGCDVGALPVEVRREDVGPGEARLVVVKRGADWEFPANAMLRLEVDPATLGPVEVPLYLSEP